ncbi:hypothetical protein [Ectothiorhodospira sp. PHS-1]|uniref:hypothetical protein n=1 Tax=Ectothiorhodospira sp. PHS-1 TaxID=519989 RepID=UPI000304762B|nr:hypothetical protein [Ectothiorhodospira sp. PHS-1]
MVIQVLGGEQVGALGQLLAAAQQKQNNLATMIRAARDRNVQIVLVAVPTPTLIRLRNAVT